MILSRCGNRGCPGRTAACSRDRVSHHPHFPLHALQSEIRNPRAVGCGFSGIGYLEFLALQRDATVVVTDSGGIQEETTYLGVPCLTVRENTERPVTVTVGTNCLIGQDMEALQRAVRAVLAGEGKKGAIPPLWDGCAGRRIADVVLGVQGGEG